MGKEVPADRTESKATTSAFFATHPVFSLGEATSTLNPPGGRKTMVERLKHHLQKGRLMTVTRGIYAVVPAGASPAEFRPDPFLTAVAVRPDAVFSHHSALELLGAAHSVWNQVTLYTEKRRRPAGFWSVSKKRSMCPIASSRAWSRGGHVLPSILRGTFGADGWPRDGT
jgi:predicted transcriptional regulator of viral defense system